MTILSPNGPLVEQQISVLVSTHLLPVVYICFLQASVYFAPAARSKREYKAGNGCGGQIFLVLVEAQQSGGWKGAGIELSQSK